MDFKHWGFVLTVVRAAPRSRKYRVLVHNTSSFSEFMPLRAASAQTSCCRSARYAHRVLYSRYSLFTLHVTVRTANFSASYQAASLGAGALFPKLSRVARVQTQKIRHYGPHIYSIAVFHVFRLFEILTNIRRAHDVVIFMCIFITRIHVRIPIHVHKQQWL